MTHACGWGCDVGDIHANDSGYAVIADQEGCPAVISGELLDREGLNAIIVHDSVALPDPWLGK